MQQIIDRYGVLTDDHPVVALILQLARKLFRDDSNGWRWLVLEQCPHDIGAAYADGTVVFSAQSLQNPITLDELAFLIAHEGVHLLKRHSKKTAEIYDEEFGSTARQFIGMSGSKRLHEYEADLEATMLLKAADFNPLAGATFFQRLNELKTVCRWSAEHGTLEDRRLNIVTAVKMLDAPSLGREQLELPDWWLEALETLVQAAVPDEELGEDDVVSRIVKSIDSGKNIPWQDIYRLFAANYPDLVMNVVGRLTQPNYSPDVIRTSPFTLIKGKLDQKASWSMLTRVVLALFNRISRLTQSREECITTLLFALTNRQMSVVAPLLCPVAVRKNERLAVELVDFPIATLLGEGEEAFLSHYATQALLEEGMLGFVSQLRAETWLALGLELDDLDFQMPIRWAQHLDVFLGEDGEIDESMVIRDLAGWLKLLTPFKVTVDAALRDMLQVIIKITFPGTLDKLLYDDSYMANSSSTYRFYRLEQAIRRENSQRLTLVEAAWSESLQKLANIFEEVHLHETSGISNEEEICSACEEYLQLEGLDLIAEWQQIRVRLSESDRDDLTFRFLQIFTAIDGEISDRSTVNEETRFRYTTACLTLVLEEFRQGNLHSNELHEVAVHRILEKESEVRMRLYLWYFREASKLKGRNWVAKEDDGSLLVYNLAALRELSLTESVEETWTTLIELDRVGRLDVYRAVLAGPGLRSDVYGAEHQIRWQSRIVRDAQVVIDRLAPSAEGRADRWLLLSVLFFDTDIQRRVVRYATQLLLVGADFAATFDMVFVQQRHNVASLRAVVDHLAENIAKTPSEIEAVQHEINQLFKEANVMSAGVATYVDGFLENCFRKSSDLLVAALTSRTSDENLRVLAFTEWWQRAVGKGNSYKELDVSVVDYFSFAEVLRDWVEKELPPIVDRLERIAKEKDYDPSKIAGLLSPAQLLDRCYRMDMVERHLIVRKLLMSEKTGVARSNDKMKASINIFLDQHVSVSQERREGLNQVLDSVLAASTPDERYFLVANQVAASIFQRPRTTTDHRSVVERVIRKDDFYSTIWKHKLPEHLQGVGYKTYGQCALAKVTRWSDPTSFGIQRSEEDLLTKSEQRVLQEFLPAEYSEELTAPRLTETQALIELATRLGAPGVRFLQLYGQYVEIPVDMEEEFSQVYDQIVGQQKLVAYETVKREVPGILSSNLQWQKRLGGGSLMTTYRIEQAGLPLPADKILALKVLNPNARLRVTDSMDLIRRILGELRQRFPQQPIYQVLETQLVADLKEWLIADIDDARYAANDQTFCQQWQDYQPDDHQFSILVPISYDLGTKYVLAEEFVEGRNLTGWTVGDTTDFESGTLSQADYRDVVSLLVKHYVAQIQLGLVHSDVHPGNFRITPKNQVAVLDRHFYLELTERDQQLILELFMSDSPASVVVNYLLELEQNSHQEPRKTEILEKLTDFNQRENFTGALQVFALLRQIREEGLQVPLRISLLLKNLNALTKLCEKAGFDHLVSAFMYDPRR